MSRVIVLGPKRLLGAVIEEVQVLGSLHIDHVESDEVPEALSRAQLSEPESTRLQITERALARVEGLLTLLPAALPSAGDHVVDVDHAAEAIDARAAEIERRVRDLTRTRLELEEEQSLIGAYEGAVRALAPLLNALQGSRTLESIGFLLNTKDLTVVTAIRTELIRATEGKVEVVSRIVDENRIGAVVAYRKQDADAVRPVLSRSGVTELRLPARFQQARPAETVALMERRKAELPGEIARINAELAAVARAEHGWLTAARALLADRLAQLKVVPELAQSRYAFILHGWAPTRDLPRIRARLRRRFGDETVVYDSPADPHHEPEQIPVLLDNRAAVRPFQRMLALFRPPRYGNLDPTIALAIFFPMFVGIVVGDMAYGALLFLLGWWMRNTARRGETWDVEIPFTGIKLGIRIPPRPLLDWSWIVRIMAVWTILFGALYLEFFGNLLEHRLGMHPVFNRVELATSFFFFAIALGIVQVMLGYVFHLILAVRHRHTIGMLEAVAMICGVAGLLAVLGAMGNQLPASFFAPGKALLAAFAVVLLIGIILNRFALMWLLEAISGMGNVLSYARLFGVGLAAAVLANVANELGGRLGVVWAGILSGILLQLFLLVFTAAGHIIQPARLNWVEFLTKFKYHDETGNSYRPFQKTGGDLG